jgi:hypothetical protein
MLSKACLRPVGVARWPEQGCGETWAEETIVGSGEDESGTETGFGDVVALGVGLALD